MSHVEVDHGADGLDLDEEVALVIPHLGELQQEGKVLSHVLAVRLRVLLNLKNRYIICISYVQYMYIIYILHVHNMYITKYSVMCLLLGFEFCSI